MFDQDFHVGVGADVCSDFDGALLWWEEVLPVSARSGEVSCEGGFSSVLVVAADGGLFAFVPDELGDVGGDGCALVGPFVFVCEAYDGAAVLRSGDEGVVADDDVVLSAADIDRVGRAHGDEVVLDEDIAIAAGSGIGKKDALRGDGGRAGFRVVVDVVAADHDGMRCLAVLGEHLQRVRMGIALALLAAVGRVHVEEAVVFDGAVRAVACHPHQVLDGVVDDVAAHGEALDGVQQQRVLPALEVVALDPDVADIAEIAEVAHPRVHQFDADGLAHGGEDVGVDAAEAQAAAAEDLELAEARAVGFGRGDRHRVDEGAPDHQVAIVARSQQEGLAALRLLDGAGKGLGSADLDLRGRGRAGPGQQAGKKPPGERADERNPARIAATL